jgi:hypothetical protein
MNKLFFALLCAFTANTVFAAPTPAEFLIHNHLPLLVKVSADSDLRIKLLRGGKIVGESTRFGTVLGSWQSSKTTLVLNYTVKSGASSENKEIRYSMKLVPKPEYASGFELRINETRLEFTQREEQVLDVNFPKISDELKAKCQQLLGTLGEAARSQGGPLALPGNEQRHSFKVDGPGRLNAQYVQNGVFLEGSLGLVSDSKWDCRYDARFILDLKQGTCGVDSFSLHHCAQ